MQVGSIPFTRVRRLHTKLELRATKQQQVYMIEIFLHLMARQYLAPVRRHSPYFGHIPEEQEYLRMQHIFAVLVP